MYAAMGKTAGAADPTTSDNPPSPQVEVAFDRDRARALGVEVGTAAGAIRAAFGGTLAACSNVRRAQRRASHLSASGSNKLSVDCRQSGSFEARLASLTSATLPASSGNRHRR